MNCYHLPWNFEINKARFAAYFNKTRFFEISKGIYWQQGRRHYASCPVFLRLNLLCCRLGFHLKLKIVAEEQDGIR